MGWISHLYWKWNSQWISARMKKENTKNIGRKYIFLYTIQKLYNGYRPLYQTWLLMDLEIQVHVIKVPNFLSMDQF